MVETAQANAVANNGIETSNSYLAKPAGNCCLKGSIHEGEPRGSYTTIAGVETYITMPTDSKSNGHILLYFPDVWGMFNNGLLIMDGFADAGYTVLGLDYFNGVRQCHFLCTEYLNSIFRILCGNIERIDMIIVIRILTMRHGKGSIWHLRTKLYPGG